MGRRIPRPYGVALWGLRDALIESDDDLAEVKIVGVRKGKIYVWKQMPGKDAYVAHITPGKISDPKHAPYLIDPPPGTEAEGPSVGDIGDPSKFSGELKDIEPMEPGEEVPGVSGAEESGWLPSKKLAMIAKKMKDLGLKPQDTFQKAIAAGEPVPDKMPEPMGLKGLGADQGIEVDVDDPDDIDVAGPEEPAKEPEEPPTLTVDQLDKMMVAKDWESLQNVAADSKLFGKNGRTFVMTGVEASVDEKDWGAAAEFAKIMAISHGADGNKMDATDWEATSEEYAEMDAEEPAGLDPELGDAIMAKDWEKVTDLAKSAKPDDLDTIKTEAIVGMQEATMDENWKVAAAAAAAGSAAAAGLGIQGEAKALGEIANSYAAKGGDPDAPGPKPTEIPTAPKGVIGEEEPQGYPWNPKLGGGSKPIVGMNVSLEHQKEYGLKPNQFLHEIAKEIYSVEPFDEANEYIDPNGKPVSKQTGKLTGAKTIIPSGETIITLPPEVVVPPPDPDEPPKPKPKAKAKKKAPPEVAPPPKPEAITPSAIKPGDLPPSVPAAQAEPVVTSATLKAAAAVKLPQGMPDPSELKLLGSGAGMGGAGEKNIYEDANGNKWLHKLAYDKGGGKAKPYAAVAQQVFSQIARMVNPNHLAIGVMTLGGKLGSLQPLVDLDEKQPDFAKTSVLNLTDDERKVMAKEQLLDWMMSQHDSHRGQFIKGADGKVYPVDKEQGFRFFGVDKLSVDYVPNPEMPVYNEMYKAWVDGKIEMDPMDLKEDLQKIEAILTQDYIKTLKPYAETLYPKKPLEQAKFLKEARRRKLDLRKDFEEFFTLLYRKKTGDKGNFNFEEGWSGKKPSKKGPKIVKKKYSSADYMQKIATDAGIVLKTQVFWSDFEKKIEDKAKVTIKITKGSGAAAQEMLAALGVSADSDAVFEGPHYDMLFLNRAEFENASVELEEVIAPKVKGKVGKAPNKPHYFPDDHEHPPAKSNSEEFASIESTTFGVFPKRFESDGPQVEGSVTRARRWTDSKGTFYHVQFKLRPHLWSKLLGKGEPSTYTYPTGSYDSKTDTFKSAGGSSESITTQKWTAGNSEIHLTGAAKSGGHWRTSKYTYMGTVNAKVRPKEGQSVAEATAELLDKMQPGLSKEVMRDSTSEEKEIHLLSQAMWAYLPQQADALPPEDKRDAASMRAALKKAKVSEKQLANIKHVEVLPGYSTHVDPGRWKKLREAGMLFPSHGIKAGNIVSILEKGALGIHERNSAGISNVGYSESQDTKSGSGEGVLGHVFTKSSGHSQPSASGASFTFDAQLIIDPRELDRLDTYLHFSDSYGCCTPYDSGFGSAATWNNRKPIETKVKGLEKSFKHHEINFKRGIAPERILRVHANNESTRVQMIKSLKAKGVNEINGVPVEDFIVAEQTSNQIYEKYVKPMEAEAE